MYEPEVDDYVVWKRPNGDWEEGWVYFKGDPVDNEKRVKDGWNSVSQYITIETGVRDKPNCFYTSGKPMITKKLQVIIVKFTFWAMIFQKYRHIFNYPWIVFLFTTLNF